MGCQICGAELITSGCSNWQCPSRNCGIPLVTPETSVVYVSDPAKDAQIASLTARLAASEAACARLREYAFADAYCPCCATTEGEHAEDCDYETDRMREARAALAAAKE